MKTFSKKPLAIAALLGLALTSGALLSLHRASPRGTTPLAPQGGVDASEPGPREARATAPSIPVRQWNLGDSFVYALDTVRGVVLKGKSAEEQKVTVRAAGALRVTVVGKDANEIQLRADFQSSSYEQQPPVAQTVVDALGKVFFFTAAPSGEIRSFQFPKEVPVETRLVLKGLVNSLQLVEPGLPRGSWSDNEQDVTGEFEASYRVVDGAVHKSKLRYVRTRGLSGLTPVSPSARFAVKSRTVFAIDASGWPSSVSEDETLELTMQSNDMTGTIKTGARLTAKESHPEWAGQVVAALESDAQSEAAARALSRTTADKNLVGGRSFKQIATELQADTSSARSQAQARMAALARLDPSATKLAADEVLHGENDTNTKRRLVGALGTAGTPEAQRALVSLLENKDAGGLRKNAAVALGLTKQPTPESAAALEKASGSPDRDVASAATLGMGSMVHSMNANHSGDTADTVNKLIDKLAHAESDAERSLYLEALGNTGDPRALPAIQPYLSSPETALRAVATGALKFMPGDAADQAVTTAMGDKEFRVRKAAVSTISYRPLMPVLAAVDSLLRSEPEESIRMDILNAVFTKTAEDPSVIDLIAWASENDPSERVRALATKMLTPQGS